MMSARCPFCVRLKPAPTPERQEIPDSEVRLGKEACGKSVQTSVLVVEIRVWKRCRVGRRNWRGERERDGFGEAEPDVVPKQRFEERRRPG
jgi:hypothetical protein